MFGNIYNEDCRVTMDRFTENSIDLILTSPFYNTNHRGGKTLTLETSKYNSRKFHHVRYDQFVDNMTNEEYCSFTVEVFQKFDRILKRNGCVLYNLSYGTKNTEGMIQAINAIITGTNFTMADVIVWEKPSAVPNNMSPNRLTRYCEFVFVLCRKSELATFHCNKKVLSYRKSGQANYENVSNVIRARNNDGPCTHNKATYSSELCEKLLRIYAAPGSVVYDPFFGTGTTAVACEHLGLEWVGSEISSKQCQFAQERIEKEKLKKISALQ